MKPIRTLRDMVGYFRCAAIMNEGYVGAGVLPPLGEKIRGELLPPWRHMICPCLGQGVTLWLGEAIRGVGQAGLNPE